MSISGLKRGPDPREIGKSLTVEEYWAAVLRQYDEDAAAARGRSPEDLRLREGLGRYLEAQRVCPQCGRPRVRLATGGHRSGTGHEGEYTIRPERVEPLDPEKQCTCWMGGGVE